MRSRWVLGALLVAGCLTATAASAAADDGIVLISDPESIDLAVDDGTATATVTLENQSARDVAVAVVTRGTAEGCGVDPASSTLPAHRQQDVEITFTRCDDVATQGIEFVISAGDTRFTLRGSPPDAPSPQWGTVALAYAGSALVAVLVLALAWQRWAPEKGTTKKLFMVLPGLSDTWKFSDSWAANATVVTAAVAGLLGSKDVVTMLFGDDGVDLLAVALVSAAFSLGLTGVSPMVLQALRKWSGEPPADKAGLYVTPAGMLLAGWLTITATGGQLWSLLLELQRADLWSSAVTIAIGVGGSLVVAWYAFSATSQNLTVGAIAPGQPGGSKKPDSSETADEQEPRALARALWSGRPGAGL